MGAGKMKYQEQIHNYVQSHKEEILNDLKTIAKIPSVVSERDGEFPYGKNCHLVLECVKKLYEREGAKSQIDKEGGYMLSTFGNGKKSLGLFAHADVVPAYDDWTVTNPFEPIEKDGFLFGRGVSDDKCAVITSIYCIKAIKELGIPFDSSLVCFTGSCEETGMEDIDNYAKKNTAPDFSLVLDSGFPLFRGDKGIFRYTATSNTPMETVSDFCGGTAFNIILGEASCTVNGKKYVGKGISQHGAHPQGSLNAGYVLANKLLTLDDVSENDKKQLKLISAILEKYYGEIYGIQNKDPDFGDLTVTTGIISQKNGKITLSFDLRHGMDAKIEWIKSHLKDFFDKNNWTLEYYDEAAPFANPIDSPYVQACINTYIDFTGDKNAKPGISAGGTYARHIPNASEIGTSLDYDFSKLNLQEGHGSCHQPDECISIKGYLDAVELTIQMVLAMDDVNKR